MEYNDHLQMTAGDAPGADSSRTDKVRKVIAAWRHVASDAPKLLLSHILDTANLMAYRDSASKTLKFGTVYGYMAKILRFLEFLRRFPLVADKAQQVANDVTEALPFIKKKWNRESVRTNYEQSGEYR